MDAQLTPIASAIVPSTPAATFDIGTYFDVPNGVLKVKNPSTGAPTPLIIELAGPEHERRKAITMGRQRRMRAVLAKTGKLPVGDPEEEDAEKTDELVACTLGWFMVQKDGTRTPGLVLNGETIPFSPEAARKIYSDRTRRWLRDQVVAALEERELFIGTSANS